MHLQSENPIRERIQRRFVSLVETFEEYDQWPNRAHTEELLSSLESVREAVAASLPK
jgi:hypothetical protein